MFFSALAPTKFGGEQDRPKFGASSHSSFQRSTSIFFFVKSHFRAFRTINQASAAGESAVNGLMVFFLPPLTRLACWQQVAAQVRMSGVKPQHRRVKGRAAICLMVFEKKKSGRGERPLLRSIMTLFPLTIGVSHLRQRGNCDTCV